MATRDLIAFVQKHYGSFQGIPNVRQRDPNVPFAQSFDDLNAIRGERPPVPDWLLGIDDQSVVSLNGVDSISLDAEIVLGAPELGRHGEQTTIDTLAYYLPYHFYSSKWGIYLRASGILYLASLLKEGPLAPGDSELLQLSRQILFEHEFFHFAAETGCSRGEVVAKRPLYEPYYPHPFGAPHEEALANAHAFRSAMRKRTPRLKTLVETWMSGQGLGYRDYHRWLSGARFNEGCRRASHYMLQATAAASSSKLIEPAEFLLSLPRRAFVPTRLVIDTGSLGVLKAFPKLAGMRILVHTNDHPPPHIHIEKPPGHPITRYVWPDLTPVPGDPLLSNSVEKDLSIYIKKHSGKIGRKVRSVYPEHFG